MPKPPKPPILPKKTGFRIHTSASITRIGMGKPKVEQKGNGPKKPNGALKVVNKVPTNVHYRVARTVVEDYFEDHFDRLKVLDHDARVVESVKIYSELMQSPIIKSLLPKIEEFELLGAFVRNIIEEKLGILRRRTDT